MAFYELIERIVEGESLEGLEGVYWKENGKIFSNPDRAQAPLDDDPPMPYHLVDIEKCLFASEFGKRTISYVSSYGCPYSCTFCVEVGVFNRRWVGLRADLVVNDLERLEKEYAGRAEKISGLRGKAKSLRERGGKSKKERCPHN